MVALHGVAAGREVGEGVGTVTAVTSRQREKQEMKMKHRDLVTQLIMGVKIHGLP